MYISVSIAFATIVIAFGLFLRKLLPQAREIFPRAKMGSSKALLLWLFFSFIYVVLSVLCLRTILYHIHLAILATKLNVSYADLNLIITIVTVPLAIGGEILVLFLFVKNIQMLPREEGISVPPSGKTWPPAPRPDR